MEKLTGNRIYLRLIGMVSILIPVIVAFLIFFPAKLSSMGEWVKLLPGAHAVINSLTVATLIGALIAIKKGNVAWHRSLMLLSLLLGVLFLISYVLYHSNVESVKYGDVNHDGIISESELAETGAGRVIYLVILASHILLSIVIVPFVLLAFYYALINRVSRHKKIVKITYPVWMYVSVTGIIVYFMIKPYYL